MVLYGRGAPLEGIIKFLVFALAHAQLMAPMSVPDSSWVVYGAVAGLVRSMREPAIAVISGGHGTAWF